MTPTRCAIIASEGIPAFGRNETHAIIIMLTEKSVFKSPNKKSKQSLVFALRFSGSFTRRGANITTASQGRGNNGVNKREADVTPPSRFLLAEAAVAGIPVNYQGEAANKQREGGENNHSDGKQQALVCLHALNHMLYRIPAVVAVVVVVICFTGIT